MYELTDKFATALLLIFAVLILVKNMQKIIMMLRGKTQDSGGHKHLDQLIKKNELKFRGSSIKPTISSSQKTNQKKPQWKNILKAEAESLKNADELESINLFITYLNELEWGEGNKLKQFERNLNSQIPIPFSQKKIKDFLLFFLDHNFHHPYHQSDRFIDYKDLDQRFLNIGLLYQLQLLLKEKKYSTYAKMLRLEPRHLENTILHFFLFLQNNDFNSSLNKVFHSKTETYRAVNYLSLEDLNIEWQKVKYQELQEGWHKILDLWSALSSLNFSKEKLSQDFLTFLKCSTKSSPDIIKKSYKNELKKRHPDRFSSYSLPDQYQKILTQNFQILQDAFDKVSKEI